MPSKLGDYLNTNNIYDDYLKSIVQTPSSVSGEGTATPALKKEDYNTSQHSGLAEGTETNTDNSPYQDYFNSVKNYIETGNTKGTTPEEDVKLASTLEEKDFDTPDYQRLLKASETNPDIHLPAYTKPYKANTAGSHVQQFLKGFGETIGSIPQAIGIAQSYFRDNKPEENELYRVGEDIKGYFDFESTSDEVKNSFAGQISQGLGNLAGFIMGGEVGSLVKGGSLVAPALLGSSQESTSLYQEAKDKGATDEQAYSAALQGAALGLTEAVPIANMFGRALGPVGLKSFNDVLKNTAKSVGEEALQEGLQTIGENAIAKYTAGYDPDRALLESVTEASGVGGITGGIASVVLNTLGLKARRLPSGQNIIETPEGYQIDPSSEMGQAYIQANKKKLLNLEKADYSKQVDPLTNETIATSDIAKASYKLNKFKNSPDNSIGKKVYKENLDSLLKNYITTDKEVDVTALREAKDVLISHGYTEEYLDAIKEKAIERSQKAKEAPKGKDKNTPAQPAEEAPEPLFEPEEPVSENQKIIEEAVKEEQQNGVRLQEETRDAQGGEIQGGVEQRQGGDEAAAIEERSVREDQGVVPETKEDLNAQEIRSNQEISPETGEVQVNESLQDQGSQDIQRVQEEVGTSPNQELRQEESQARPNVEPTVNNVVDQQVNDIQEYKEKTGEDLTNTNLKPIDVKSAPKFKISNVQKAKVISVGRNLADKVKSNVGNLDVIVAKDLSDLDQYPLARESLTPKWNTAGGFFIPSAQGKTPEGMNLVVMFADQYASEKQLVQDMYHEIVGHYGIREVLGQKNWLDFISKTLQTNKKATKAAYDLRNRWGKYYLNQDKDGVYSLTKDGKPFVVNKPTVGYIQVDKGVYAETNTMAKFMDEYIAEEAKKYADPKKQEQENKVVAFIKRIIAYTRHKLRSVFGYELASTVTDNDIAGLLSISYRAYIEGDPVTNVYKKAQQERKRGNTEESLVKLVQQAEPGYQPVVATDINEGNLLKASAKHPFDGDIDAAIKDAQSRGTIIDAWRKTTENIENRTRSALHFSGMANITDRDWVMRLERQGIGTANSLDRKARNLAKAVFSPLEKNNKRDIANKLLEMWEDGTITNLKLDQNNKLSKESYNSLPESIKQDVSYLQMNLLKDWNEDLIANQKFFINKGHLRQDTSLGTYVPTMYEDFIDQYRGSGWAPSNFDWKKGKVNKENAQFLSPIEDPKTRLIFAVTQLGHDAAKYNLFSNLALLSEVNNKGWVLGRGSRIKVELEKVPYFDMSTNADGETQGTVTTTRSYSGLSIIRNRIQDAIDSKLLDPESKIKLERNVQVLDNALEQLHEEILSEQNITPEDFNKNYTFIDPRKYKNFGDLRGTYVHKEIWNELFGDGNDARFDGALKVVNDMFGSKTGRNIEKGNAMWKAFKTLWNVPGYWTRAFLGTGMMVDMATDTSSVTMAKYWMQELKDSMDQDKAVKYKGKTLLEWGVENGAGGTSLGDAELYSLLKDVRAKVSLKDLHNAVKETATGKNKWWQTGHLGLMLATDKISVITQRLSDANANMDLFFRLSMMRDFVNQYQKEYKNTSADLNNLSEVDTTYFMQRAAEYAAKGVPEYNIGVGDFIKVTRRGLFGAPFLTFNYKLAGMTANAVLNRPQKFIKYPLLGWILVEGLMALSGMDDDEYEDAVKNMPYWTKDKAAVLPIPFKDSTGQMSYLDLSYVIPPAFYLDLIKSVASPAPGESRIGNAAGSITDQFGLFGGVFPQIITATTGNVNPFTGRDIVESGMTTSEKAQAWSTFIWDLATIPALSSSGAIADIMNQAEGQKTKEGLDKQSVFSDILTNLGITTVDYRPSIQAVKNANRFAILRRDIITARNKKIKDPNISVEERTKAIAESMERIKQLNQQQYTK